MLEAVAKRQLQGVNPCPELFGGSALAA